MQTAHRISLLVAILGGLAMLQAMPNGTGFLLLYAFGIACGGAGSRFAAILRKGI